jgi:hypothetical protein
MGMDATPCQHRRISQLSVVHARTYWSRGTGGSYEPEPTGPICLSEILAEETEGWRCEECGTRIALEADGLVIL